MSQSMSWLRGSAGMLARQMVPAALRVRPTGLEQRRYKSEKAKPDMNLYPLAQAIEKAKNEAPKRNFEESIDFSMFLNIDPRKADHQIRTLTVLPHGTGKEVKVCVFALDDAQIEQAKEAGAYVVGGEELVNEVKNGRLDFDRTVATPQAMRLLSKVARVLGPRGLMPNNKLGTVTDDVAGKVKELMGGITLRADKAGNVHAMVGKVRSRKLRRYLIARHAAEGLPVPEDTQADTFAARARRRHVDAKNRKAAQAA